MLEGQVKQFVFETEQVKQVGSQFVQTLLMGSIPSGQTDRHVFALKLGNVPEE